MDKLSHIIIVHEGLRLKPYRDTTGHLTIGIGRNLDDNGISEDEAYMMLDRDLLNCELWLSSLEWFTNLNDVRQGVLIELVFNLGSHGFLGFNNMIQAIKNSDFVLASEELLNSLWAKQVGENRSNNLAIRLLTGEYDD